MIWRSLSVVILYIYLIDSVWYVILFVLVDFPVQNMPAQNGIEMEEGTLEIGMGNFLIYYMDMECTNLPFSYAT